MKTLLVLARHPEFVEAIRAAVEGGGIRLLRHAEIEEAEAVLTHGLVDACIVDAELATLPVALLLEKLKRRAPDSPVILYLGPAQRGEEEQAYLRGATHVLEKPVRPRLLAELIERLQPAQVVERRPGTQFIPLHPVATVRPPESPQPVGAPPQTLALLRDFSAILTHSLNSEAMLRQFLLLLREMFSISRAVIFLRPPYGQASDSLPRTGARLHSASSLGVSASLLQHFELSGEEGIGGQVLRLGRIVRTSSDSVRVDPVAMKEFDLLGMEVAVPIMDRETTLGIAFFDRRITGEPLVNAELELIYHFLEQLGLALKNTYLHTALSANHELVTGILRELSSACVVVRADDLSILHANKMASKLFAPDARASELVFTDLPHAMARKIQQVLKTGAAIAGESFIPEHRPDAVYRINILPFERRPSGLPASALLVAEDLTRSEQLRHAELENANLRQVRNIAEKLTTEIGNAMLPMALHQQMLAEMLGKKAVKLDVLGVIGATWGESIKRVTRRIEQWRYLATEGTVGTKSIPLKPLIEEAYAEACKHQPAKDGVLKLETSIPAVVNGDRDALRTAFTEVMINALQANPSDPKIGVRVTPEAADTAHAGLQIEVQDNGAGFSEEATRRAAEPFYGTRVVGMGLGLAVSRKIIENHRGKLEIVRPSSEKSGVVRISLPTEAPSN